MPEEPRDRVPSEDHPYRLYSGGEGSAERPYNTYRARPRGLRARLRGEEDTGLDDHPRDGGSGGRNRQGRDAASAETSGWRRARRIGKYVLIAAVAWVLVSVVLFVISTQNEQGNFPDSARAALTSGGNMVTSSDTVLVIGTDQRPPGSKEPGANTNDAGSRSDTLMLWRIGGGASRRLSIPRDTVAAIPGHGTSKINAAYAYGGPALTIRTVEAFTGLKINHAIVVNLAAFPQFVDAIGGVDVSTGRICSDISGGTRNGGFSLYLPPGTHHLSGREALTLARTRHNKCNPSESDLTRAKRQQQILNAMKGQLFTPGTFFRLPWASWDAPKVLRTDMGAPTLLSLFAASGLGGSAAVQVLKPTGAATLPDGESVLTVTPDAVRSAVARLTNG